MKKNKRLCILLTLYFSIGQIDAQTPLSFEESLHLLNQGNQSLKIADKSIEIAKAERDKLNAFWYPSLQSTGAFVHMSEKIEVKQPLSQFTDPAKDFVHSIIPDDQIISVNKCFGFVVVCNKNSLKSLVIPILKGLQRFYINVVIHTISQLSFHWDKRSNNLFYKDGLF